jgi:hypothetical protein
VGQRSEADDIAGMRNFFPPTMRDTVNSASASELSRLRVTQRFVNDHRFALLVECAFLKADVSRNDGDDIAAAFAGGDNPGDSASLPGHRQLSRYMDTAMQCYYDDRLPAVIPFRNEYEHASLGPAPLVLSAAYCDLKQVIILLLEDAQFSHLPSMFVGDHDRDILLTPRYTPNGERVVAGEPMVTGSYYRRMNDLLRSKHENLAAELDCVGVLPLALSFSFDGTCADKAQRKGLNVVFLNVYNRPLHMRKSALSWVLFALFVTLLVGKDKSTKGIRGMIRRLSTHDQLRRAVTESVVALSEAPFPMTSISGAGGARWLVAVYWGKCSCDALAANEATGTVSKSCPFCICQHGDDQGRHFPMVPGMMRPSIRKHETMISAVQDYLPWSQTQKPTAAEKEDALLAKSELAFLRMKHELPGLHNLKKIMPPEYENGLFGRVDFKGALHLFENGLLQQEYVWLTDLVTIRGGQYFTLLSARIGDQPGFYNANTEDRKVSFSSGVSTLNLSGVPAKSKFSLLILTYVSLGVEPMLLLPERHQLVVRAVEDLIILYLHSSLDIMSAEDLVRLDALIGIYLESTPKAMEPSIQRKKGGRFGRTKTHALNHLVEGATVDGTSAQYTEGPTETAGKLFVKDFYESFNKVGDTSLWLIQRYMKKRFAQGILRKMLGLSPLSLYENAVESEDTIYRTAIKSGSRLNRSYVLFDALDRNWRGSWSENFPDRPCPTVIDSENIFIKERALVHNGHFQHAYIVATDQTHVRSGGMATSVPRGRHDFVQLLGTDARWKDRVVMVQLIFTFKDHPLRLGAPSMRHLEHDFVFVQLLAKPRKSPFRLFDFRHLEDPAKAKSFGVFPLSAVVRTRWVLHNFTLTRSVAFKAATYKVAQTSRSIGGAKNKHDGYLVWKQC